jgi:hypothetical protein
MTERPGLLELTPAAARGEPRLNGQRPVSTRPRGIGSSLRARLLAWGGNI